MSAQTTDLEMQFQTWISEAFQSYNFKDITLRIIGVSEVGEGFVSDIAFAKVTGIRNKVIEELDVVIKYGKRNALGQIPVHLVFANEMHFYSVIVPIFKKLEEKSIVDAVDTFLPKCYKTLTLENQQVIVLQNLKSLGYELYDRYRPLNTEHLKLTFEKYGQLHGFFMAFRETQPAEYQKVISKMTCETAVKEFFKGIKSLFSNAEQTLYSILETEGEPELLEKLKKLTPKGFGDKHMEFLGKKVEKCVVSHGDCWNNNYMYTYSNDSKPKSVVLLDFQLSQLVSPVYDLSHHLYSTGSEEEFQQLPTLIRIYHESLSNCLKQLGCNPDKVFSFSELEEHWKAYSLFGLIMGAVAVPFVLSDKEDAVNLETANDSQVQNIYEATNRKNYARMSSRLLAVVKHYFSSNSL